MKDYNTVDISAVHYWQNVADERTNTIRQLRSLLGQAELAFEAVLEKRDPVYINTASKEMIRGIRQALSQLV